MNKKFADFFSSYGLVIKDNLAYGIINGYETNAKVNVLDNVSPLRMHISFYATDDQKRSVESAIRNLALKRFNMQFSPYGLSLGFNDITMNGLLKRLSDILNMIFGILSENKVLKSGFCPVCGNPINESDSKKCNIDGYTITIDNKCVETINSVINAENQDFYNAPNNYFKGFLGALIGGVVGAIVSILLNVLGFVSSLAAIISIVLGTFLYQKFHGKPNKVMIVIVSLTTLVLLAATIPVIYIAVAGIAANNEGLSISAIEAFKICMSNDEFSRLFYVDLALIVFFSAIGTVFEIFVLAKKIKRKTNI